MKVELISITDNCEQIIEESGRTCYKSKVGNPSIIKNWIKSGHECYDLNTEVLTDSGFKKFSDISPSDCIANIDPLSMSLIGFEKPKKYIKEMYQGKMYYFNTSKINLMITPNHKLFTSLSNTVNNRLTPNFKLLRCDDLVINTDKKIINSPMRMKTNINFTKNTLVFNPFDFKDVESFYKLIGFFIGDGYTDGTGNFIYFHLKKERKIKYLKDICLDLNLELFEHKNNKYAVKFYNFGKFFRDNFYDNNKEKTIPKKFLHLKDSCIINLLDGLVESDGHISSRDNQVSFSTSSKNVANMFQTLNALISRTYSLIIKDQRGFGSKQIYSLSYKSRSSMPHLNDSRSNNSYVTTVDYNDYVYCVNVSSGLLMVRRDNKIVLSGNSVIEHASATFRISEVSRALTHQLVRHRISSYSQESQRYVNQDQFKFVTPDSIFLTEMNSDYNILMEAIQDFYDKAIELGIKKEDARYVLPNACHTEIVVTMNFRSWRNFLKLRMDKHAQWEIRKMANEIYIILNENAPNVFGDLIKGE